MKSHADSLCTVNCVYYIFVIFIFYTLIYYFSSQLRYKLQDREISLFSSIFLKTEDMFHQSKFHAATITQIMVTKQKNRNGTGLGDIASIVNANMLLSPAVL